MTILREINVPERLGTTVGRGNPAAAPGSASGVFPELFPPQIAEATRVFGKMSCLILFPVSLPVLYGAVRIPETAGKTS